MAEPRAEAPVNVNTIDGKTGAFLKRNMAELSLRLKARAIVYPIAALIGEGVGFLALSQFEPQAAQMVKDNAVAFYAYGIGAGFIGAVSSTVRDMRAVGRGINLFKDERQAT